MAQYDEKTDRILNLDELCDMTPADFFRLALACLDQAGATVDEQRAVNSMLLRLAPNPEE